MKTPRKRARIWALIAVFAGGIAPPAADAVAGQEIRGSVFVETRIFPNDPLFAEQNDAVFSPSIGLTPEFIWWPNGDGPELRLTPMLRLDAHDASRTHFDVREASALWLRDGWTLMAGVGKVFWGTTESVHLVDIVNQTDGVEDIDGEDKLGQPMVNFTLERDWGALDLFVMPFFRERTYPGSEGRLRGLTSVLDDAVYESDAGRWRPDFAARWSHSLGSIDLGVAGFYGTSREPYLLPADVGGCLRATAVLHDHRPVQRGRPIHAGSHVVEARGHDTRRARRPLRRGCLRRGAHALQRGARVGRPGPAR